MPANYNISVIDKFIHGNNVYKVLDRRADVFEFNISGAYENVIEAIRPTIFNDKFYHTFITSMLLRPKTQQTSQKIDYLGLSKNIGALNRDSSIQYSLGSLGSTYNDNIFHMRYNSLQDANSTIIYDFKELSLVHLTPSDKLYARIKTTAAIDYLIYVDSVIAEFLEALY